MDKLSNIALLVTVAAASPGPNNLIVMNSAAKSGLVNTLPHIAGVVIGTMALLVSIIAGLGRVFAESPGARLAIVLTGCIYLAWLGLRLAVPGVDRHAGSAETCERGLPSGFTRLIVLQFLNPKSWVVMITAVAAAGAHVDLPVHAMKLIVLFALIPLTCLLIWSSIGVAKRMRLTQPGSGKWLDRAMGAALFAFSLLLLTQI